MIPAPDCYSSSALCGKCYASWHRPPWGDDDEVDFGSVVTPLGVVNVYAQGSEVFEYSRVDAAFEGREYWASWDKRYSRRYLVTLARRFMEELCG